MTLKKILGIVFIIIAIFLALAIIGQLPKFLGLVFGFFKFIQGRLNPYDQGRWLGTFVVYGLHVAITIALFIIGTRWIRKQ